MWTEGNRTLYDRCELRYKIDHTNIEWALICPLIPPAIRAGNKRVVDVCDVVNGVMFILATGCRAEGPAAAQHGEGLSPPLDYDRTLGRIRNTLYVKCRKLASKQMDCPEKFAPGLESASRYGDSTKPATSIIIRLTRRPYPVE